MNTYEQLKKAVENRLINQKQAIAISYHRHEPREVRSNGCQVWSPFFSTDKDAHFSNYGAKSFTGNKKESLPRATEWAVKTYGELNFVRNKLGDYVPKVVNDNFPIIS